jgi:hypothetical protein
VRQTPKKYVLPVGPFSLLIILGTLPPASNPWLTVHAEYQVVRDTLVPLFERACGRVGIS